MGAEAFFPMDIVSVVCPQGLIARPHGTGVSVKRLKNARSIVGCAFFCVCDNPAW